MTVFSPETMRNAVTQIAPEVQKRFESRQKTVLNEMSLWHELTCCLLSSQVVYELAVAASEKIYANGIFTTPHRRNHKSSVAKEIRNLLESTIEVNGVSKKYRFPRSRSRQLAETWEIVGTTFGSLTAALESFENAGDTRRWMVEKLPGFGPKQSSMFLRNIAYSFDVAIIDRHVTRYMVLTGIYDELPSRLGSLKYYEQHESVLRHEADEYGLQLGILDWSIWIVMRAAGREYTR